MKIRSVKYSVLAAMYLFAFALFPVAAEERETIEVPAKKDELEEARFKDEMETRLTRDIQAYLGNNRFIVHVEAELKKTRTVVKEETGGRSATIPEKPVFSYQPLPAYSSRDRTEETIVDELLPGLPIGELPAVELNNEEVDELKVRVRQLEDERQQALNYAEQLRQEAQSQIRKIEEKTLGFRNSIKKLTVTLVLDKSLTDEQVEFIRNLVTRKIRLDELRGDTINIVRTEFKDLDTDQPVLDWWEEYQGWLMIAAFGFMMLLLLLALYLFNKRLSEGLKEAQRRSENFDNLTVPAAVDLAPIDNGQNGDKDTERRRMLSEIRQELVTIGLGQPQLFQQRLAEQLNTDQYQASAALYKVMGKSLFRSLCPKIPARQMEAIEDYADRTEADTEQQIATLSELQQSLIRALGEDDAGTAPFAFLEKLNDSQVLYLIREEDTRIKALVLSQLPADRAAQLVQRLPDQEKSGVAYELGQFETLPVSAFRDVADRLAQKSLNVPSFENITADGLSVLIRMLDNMSSGEETRLLKTLKTDKPETYYRLRQVYYTYADLMRTPDRVIANELRDIDRVTLAQSLCNTPTEFKRHLLSGLPVKLRSSVISELKVIEHQITRDQMEGARRKIVSKMREVLKAGRFSMDELSPVRQAG